MHTLKAEVKQLEQQALKEETQVQQIKKSNTKQLPGNSTNEAVQSNKGFKISHKLNLISKQAAYSLTIQSQLPIDTILLQCNQSVDILKIEDKKCKENDIEDSQNGNMLLTTLKVDSEDTN